MWYEYIEWKVFVLVYLFVWFLFWWFFEIYVLGVFMWLSGNGFCVWFSEGICVCYGGYLLDS